MGSGSYREIVGAFSMFSSQSLRYHLDVVLCSSAPQVPAPSSRRVVQERTATVRIRSWECSVFVGRRLKDAYHCSLSLGQVSRATVLASQRLLTVAHCGRVSKYVLLPLDLVSRA